MFNFFSAKEKLFENLRGADFKQKYNETENAVLVDVRTAGEFNSGTLPKAMNMDFLSTAFMDKFRKQDKNKTYFLFCRSGARSAQACEVLSQEGFKVYNLAGGIGAWPR